MNGLIETPNNTELGELVDLARRQDEDAVVALIRRCTRRIVAAIEIAGVSRRHADFDDAQNQALLEIWRQMPSLRDGEATCGWMHRIARRSTASRIIDPAVRHRRRTERYLSLVSDDGHEPGPAETVARHDLLGQVLSGLSPEHREVLVMRFLEGYSEAETADLLDIPIKTVSSRTSRAKRAAMDLVNAIEGEAR